MKSTEFYDLWFIDRNTSISSAETLTELRVSISWHIVQIYHYRPKIYREHFAKEQISLLLLLSDFSK